MKLTPLEKESVIQYSLERLGKIADVARNFKNRDLLFDLCLVGTDEEVFKKNTEALKAKNPDLTQTLEELRFIICCPNKSQLNSKQITNLQNILSKTGEAVRSYESFSDEVLLYVRLAAQDELDLIKEATRKAPIATASNPHNSSQLLKNSKQESQGF